MNYSDLLSGNTSYKVVDFDLPLRFLQCSLSIDFALSLCNGVFCLFVICLGEDIPTFGRVSVSFSAHGFFGFCEWRNAELDLSK